MSMVQYYLDRQYTFVSLALLYRAINKIKGSVISAQGGHCKTGPSHPFHVSCPYDITNVDHRDLLAQKRCSSKWAEHMHINP